MEFIQFSELARRVVLDNVKLKYANEEKQPNLEMENVTIVWFCKTLQNWKAIVITDLNDEELYEVTYNGNKQEIYLDAYKKYRNVCIPD